MIFGGELGLPTVVPMEVALLLVGAYAVPSPTVLVGGLLLVTAADLAGSTLLYLALRTGGRRLVARILRRHGERTPESAGRWRRRWRGHDVALVCLGRMVPLVRMYVPLGAALGGLAPRQYLLGAAPGGAVWAGTPLVAGYLCRADVRQIAAGYTRFAHVLLFALPAIGGVALVGWWIWAARGARARLYRGRAAVGLAAIVSTAVYVGGVVVENERAADAGAVSIPLPVLVAWSLLLAGLTLTLVAVTLADLRARPGRAEPGAPRRHHEVAVTVAWVGLLAAVGVVMVAIELRYPRL